MVENLIPSAPSTLIRGLLPFELPQGTMLQAFAQQRFKPHGLMLFNCGDLDLLMQRIGRTEQLVCSFGPVPSRWFGHWESFAALSKAIDEGKEPPAWGDWDSVEVGNIVRLEFSAPLPPNARALMWGTFIRF